MKKYQYKIALASLLLLFITSCSDFLDVVPQDKILENESYSNEAGIQTVHNGIYLQLAGDDLYGKQLTMDAVEILGQQYEMGTSHIKNKIATYAYADQLPKTTFANIWLQAYKTILSCNKFLENMGKYSGVVSVEKANELKGEAVAIRALLHFDMLRLYGPIYKVSPANPSIPYYDAALTSNNPILPANEAVNRILADLDTALELLKNDPILTSGKYNVSSAFDGNPYYSMNRGQRMNYLAVKCLKARVLIYAGKKEEASVVANEVISFTKTTSFFPWTPFLEAVNATNPDRTFSSENFFSLSTFKLYEKQKELFDASLSISNIYAPLLNRINAVFESNDNDYRNLSSWKIPVTGGKSGKTFLKYEDVPDKNKVFRLQIPMFKLSEMYLIAAETAANPANGIDFLNTLRFNRGLNNLAATANVTTETAKEYKKEFIGEGQLFFYYKRTNTTAIPNGSATSGNIAMGISQYVVPLPDAELNFQ